MRFGLDLHESITANMRPGRRRFFGTNKEDMRPSPPNRSIGTRIGMSINAYIGLHQEPRKGSLSGSVLAFIGGGIA